MFLSYLFEPASCHTADIANEAEEVLLPRHGAESWKKSWKLMHDVCQSQGVLTTFISYSAVFFFLS